MVSSFVFEPMPKKKVKTKKTKAVVAVVPPTPPMDQSTTEDLKMLLGLGDKELIFFLKWLECGMNATQAYMKLNPHVTKESAGVLGARMLGKVSVPVVLDAMGVGAEKYLAIYRDALDATSSESVPYQVRNKKGEMVTKYKRVATPNWDVRERFHKRLGQLLRFEVTPGSVIQVNNQNSQQNVSSLPDSELDALLSR